jgi:thiosulfate/3-mercaptopyruvate sulfurtransferase
VSVDALVTAEWLQGCLDRPEVRVVEVDVSPAAYMEGHIKGAVLWNIYTDLKDGEYRLVERDDLEQLFRRSGIDRSSTVVVYGYAAAMGFWLLKLFGHEDVRLLDGGRAVWESSRGSMTTAVLEPRETCYRLPEVDEPIRVGRAAVEQAIGDPGSVILDVRTTPEYEGERFWPSGALEEGGRAGHVPGAAHLAASELFDTDGRFRPVAELRDIHQHLDLSGHEVIPYCTIGARACASWFVLTYLLGHPAVRVYDGSWAEWGRTSGAPISC